jgi:excisionase family DNA binding protein
VGLVADAGVLIVAEKNDQPKSSYTPSEAARLIGVDSRTLVRWEELGRLTSSRTLGGHRRYSAEQVEALAVARRAGTLNRARVLPRSALSQVIAEHYGGNAVAALRDLSDLGGIAVAYLDRSWLANHLAWRGDVLTDEQWARIASGLHECCGHEVVDAALRLRRDTKERVK